MWNMLLRLRHNLRQYLAPVSATSTDFDHALPGFGQTPLGRVQLHLVNAGQPWPRSTKLSPNSTNIGWIGPSSDRIRPTLGLARPSSANFDQQLGPMSGKFGPASVSFGPNSCRNRSNLDQHRSRYVQSWPVSVKCGRFRQFGADFEQNWAMCYKNVVHPVSSYCVPCTSSPTDAIPGDA